MSWQDVILEAGEIGAEALDALNLDQLAKLEEAVVGLVVAIGAAKARRGSVLAVEVAAADAAAEAAARAKFKP